MRLCRKIERFRKSRGMRSVLIFSEKLVKYHWITMPYEIKNNGLQNFEIITVEETDWDTIPIEFSSCNRKGHLFSRGDNVSVRLKENESGEGRIIEIRGKWVLILWYYDLRIGLCESTYVDVVPIESIKKVSKIEFGKVVVQRHLKTGYAVARGNSKVLWIHDLFSEISLEL
jgi:regulation of enolase protein 1 (concanavalin A-like superfamily)